MTDRIIKFRAWDKQNKEFVADNVVGNILYEIHANKHHDLNDGFVLQEFVGLQDKNGKGIFEGDILKGVFSTERSYKNFNNGLVKYAKVRCAFVVEINKGEYNNYEDITSCKTDGRIDITTLRDHYMEVVGNIFETPELLKYKIV